MPTEAPSAAAPTSQPLRYEIDRGPNWLIIRIHPDQQRPERIEDWAEELWAICHRHFTYRLVVEMDEVDSLPAPVVEALDALRERLGERGGALRLSGLSSVCEKRLDDSHTALQSHSTRRDAVLASDSHESVLKPRG